MIQKRKQSELDKAGYIVIFILYIIGLIILINKYEFVAKYWGFLGAIYALFNYLYMFKSGKTYNPISYFKNLNKNQELDYYQEYGFDLNIYDNLSVEIAVLKQDLEEIKRTITMHHKTFGEKCYF